MHLHAAAVLIYWLGSLALDGQRNVCGEPFSEDVFIIEAEADLK